jgi:hypothetical protein
MNMTSDITEEQRQKNHLKSIRFECLKLAIESNVAHQDGKQLIVTAKMIDEYLKAEDESCVKAKKIWSKDAIGYAKDI